VYGGREAATLASIHIVVLVFIISPDCVKLYGSALPWPAPFRLSHDHVAITSLSDQYYVARILGTRLQKLRPCN